MVSLYEKFKTQMTKAKQDLNALAKKYDLKVKPKTLDELRDHELIKLSKHDEGNFHYYAQASDHMPVLIVSSAKNVKIDNDYHALVEAETKSPQMYGTFKIDRKLKVMTFTLENNSSSDIRSKALVEKHTHGGEGGSVLSLLEGLRFCTGWKTPSVMVFQQSGLTAWSKTKIFDCLQTVEELAWRSGGPTWEAFMIYSLNKAPEGLFGGLVTEFKKSPTKERAILLAELFCTDVPAKKEQDLSINVKDDKNLLPKNQVLAKVIADAKNGKAPQKDIFDTLVKCVTLDKDGAGPLGRLLDTFDPDAKAAEQIDFDKNLPVSTTGGLRKPWEAAREKLEKVGKFNIKNVK